MDVCIHTSWCRAGTSVVTPITRFWPLSLELEYGLTALNRAAGFHCQPLRGMQETTFSFFVANQNYLKASSFCNPLEWVWGICDNSSSELAKQNSSSGNYKKRDGPGKVKPNIWEKEGGGIDLLLQRPYSWNHGRQPINVSLTHLCFFLPSSL